MTLLQCIFACTCIKKISGIVGTFGRVLECWDRENHDLVAIKVVRSIRKYRHAAKIEIDVLNLLARNDRANSRYA